MYNSNSNYRRHMHSVRLIFLLLLTVCAVLFFNSAALADGEAFVTVGSLSFPADSETLDLTTLTAADLEQAIDKLSAFTNLKKIVLSVKDTEGKETVSTIPLDSFLKLIAAAPEAEYDYCFEMAGVTISTSSTEELEFKKRTDFTDTELAQLRAVLPYMQSLKSITVFKCGTTDEAMEQLRMDFAEINIRWVVRFAAFSAWNDTEKIWAMAGLYDDADSVNLKYFHNLKYLDLGHNGLTKCEFLYGTPNVEVLIMAVGDMEDITPVASLKHLEYLEICDSKVTDLSPLASCTTLEHLNIGGIRATDLTPLYSLTNLKRLFADNMWAISDYDLAVYQLKFEELLPDAQLSFQMGVAGGTENGLWRYSRGAYTGSFVSRYQLLCEQFGYDDNEQAYVYDY